MRTQLTTRQILDRTITSDDVDISTPGKGMVTRIVPGANIKLTAMSSGAVSGAGEVKVSVEMFGAWESGVTYGAESVIRYQGILLRVVRDHDTTGMTFQECLEYYSPLSSSIRIINSPGHGIPAFKPVYMYNKTTIRPARSNSTDTCSTHITLVVNNNWLLIADTGEYTFTAHGIGGPPPGAGSVNFMYLSASADGELVASRSGLTNICPVVTVLDADRFLVTTYRGIVNLGSGGLVTVTRADLDTTNAGHAVIAKVRAGRGLTISSTGVDEGTGDVTVSQIPITGADVSIPAGTKNLVGINTVNAFAAKFDTFKSSIDRWTAGYDYLIGDTAIWNGLLFTCLTAHRSGQSFPPDLGKWTCNSPNAMIRSDGSMISVLQAIYYNDSNIPTRAIANSDTTCAEYVVIAEGGGYYLAAKSGRFNSRDILPAIMDGTPSGPFPVGRFYCSALVPGEYTQSIPTYVNPVFSISADRTIIEIEAEKDVICNAPSHYDNSTLISAVDLVDSPLELTINVPVGAKVIRVIWALDANNASANIYTRFDNVSATSNYFTLRSYYNHSTNGTTNDDLSTPGLYMGNMAYYSHGELTITMPSSSASVTAFGMLRAATYASNILYRFDCASRYTRPSVTSAIQTLQVTSVPAINVTGYIRIYASQ